MSIFFNFYPNTLYLHSSSNPNVINSLIAKGIYALDQYVRQDICDGCIMNKRDYVSTLMSYTRLFFRNFQVVKQFYHCQSQILSNNLEQEFGCDALILFCNGKYAKVCLFEAKYPRLKQCNYRCKWDDCQNNSRYSHFHDQLIRQNNWSSSAFIWELFINNNLPGHSIKGFDKYGSTCIWHEDAYKYSEKNVRNYYHCKYHRWNNNKLKECVDQLPYNPLNLEDILNSILSSGQEKLIPVTEDRITIESREGKKREIPASISMIRDNHNNFFGETGINNFLFIEFENTFSEIIAQTVQSVNIDEIEF